MEMKYLFSSNDFNNVELGQKVGPKISSGSTVRQICKNSTINNLCMTFCTTPPSTYTYNKPKTKISLKIFE